MMERYNDNSIYSPAFGQSVRIANSGGKSRIFSQQAEQQRSSRSSLGSSTSLASDICKSRKSFRSTPQSAVANRYVERRPEGPSRLDQASSIAVDALVAGGLCALVGVTAPVALSLRFATRVGLPAGEKALRELDTWSRRQLDALAQASKEGAENLAPSKLASSSAFCASVCLVTLLNSKPRSAEAMPHKGRICWSAPLSKADQCKRKAIAIFLRTKTKEEHPDEMSDILVRTTKHPIELAAMMKIETNGVAGLVGSSGEVSKFQIMHFHLPRRFNPNNDVEAACVANKVICGTIKASHGSTWDGVRKYNGRGKRALIYAKKVWKYRRQIKDIEASLIQQEGWQVKAEAGIAG